MNRAAIQSIAEELAQAAEQLLRRATSPAPGTAILYLGLPPAAPIDWLLSLRIMLDQIEVLQGAWFKAANVRPAEDVLLGDKSNLVITTCPSGMVITACPSPVHECALRVRAAYEAALLVPFRPRL